jgi:tetratricopeptide (TPR) repeat protein
MPEGAVAPLVAARLLRAAGRSDEASAALELALERARQPAPPGCPEGVHVAAEAEVLALLGRWVEAERSYKLAVDLMPRDDVRRSWWLNLADLYLRLGNPDARRNAWEAARGPDPREEITARAIRDQAPTASAWPARPAARPGRPPVDLRRPPPAANPGPAARPASIGR